MIKKRPIRQIVVVLTTAALTMTGAVVTAVPASAATVQTSATVAAPTTQQIRDYILRQVNEERAGSHQRPVQESMESLRKRPHQKHEGNDDGKYRYFKGLL